MIGYANGGIFIQTAADTRKLADTPEDFKAFIEEANRHSDPANRLSYTGGFVHVGCGGAAERPSNYGAGAFCQACGRTIPVEETEKA